MNIWESVDGQEFFQAVDLSPEPRTTKRARYVVEYLDENGDVGRWNCLVQSLDHAICKWEDSRLSESCTLLRIARKTKRPLWRSFN